MPTDLAALAAPTPPDEIKQRQGPGGKRLDYIDARYVMERFDSAVGPECWQDRYNPLPSGSVEGGIGVKVGDEWVWKWDIGDPSDIEPVKGAYSDAFKRAAVKWGVGRDLYGDHARPSVAPRTAPAPRQTPQPVNVPAGADEEEEAAFAALLREAESAPLFGSEEAWPEGCPKHRRPWAVGRNGGRFCSAKDDAGPKGYCVLHPGVMWEGRMTL